MKKLLITSALVVITLSHANERDNVNVVGSSTVFPFATVVAETFGKSGGFKTPKIESTGSGGGMKLFCAGTGTDTPDITNASRRIKSKEFKKCQKNGVTDITEVLIGFDGIAIANSKKSEQFSLSRQQLFLALAKSVPAPDGSEKLVPNPYSKWSDIDAALPAIKIEVLGPPPSSGTRDAFAELVLEGGCKQYDWIKAMKKADKKAYKSICHSIREDGAYIEAGENDNLIVQKLEANPYALGIFGYSFLEQNTDKVQGSVIEGITPKFDTIASGEYKVSRPLYFYVKNAHIGKIPGIKEYVELFASEDMVGDEGELIDKGLIPLSEEERDNVRAAIADGKTLTEDMLKGH
ncbi:MAG: phosphate ABC transporter substrate-binding protein [Gammaproteobacteria bacterium]|nr:MAG: phosphate ABC transporter substrate-binding protein [Gammaproteobacteria bacterium]